MPRIGIIIERIAMTALALFVIGFAVLFVSGLLLWLGF